MQSTLLFMLATPGYTERSDLEHESTRWEVLQVSRCKQGDVTEKITVLLGQVAVGKPGREIRQRVQDVGTTFKTWEQLNRNSIQT